MAADQEPQRISTVKPLYVVTDKSEKYLTANEALYLKNYRIEFNLNSSGSEGGNFGLGTPIRSNKKFSVGMMPIGKNATIGTYESKETNQIYYLNWNSNNFHGIYRINGDTLKWEIVIVDPILNFSYDPLNEIPPHRAALRVYYENNNNGPGKKIKEIYFIYTDGLGWQRFINIQAAVATGGFDASQFPYWALRPPQMDRQEYIDLAIRPPMFPITASAIAPGVADVGKPNDITNKSIQFAAAFQNSDQRTSVLGPTSVPYIQKTSQCNFNTSGLSRCLDLTINVGSAMVERVFLYQRLCGGDWELYDTIERFDGNLPDSYWLRTGDWNGLPYDPDTNTITYTYCGDKQTGLVDQADANRIQTDLPLVSIGMTPAGDEIILTDNLYGYPNFPKSELAKFQLSVQDKSSGDGSFSVVETRKITLYAFLATDGGFNAFIYYNGVDTTLRFGGIAPVINPVTNTLISLNFSPQQSDYLQCGVFPNKNLVCYLAGTPYYAIATQGFIDMAGNFTEEDSFNIGDEQVIRLIENVYSQGRFIVQKFEFDVPPGKYIARMARQQTDLNQQYQKTSTSVIGLADKAKFNGMNGLPNWDQVETFVKEIEVDVCAGDYDAWKTTNAMFYIFVPVIFNGNYRFVEGYLREDSVTLQPFERCGYDRQPGFGGLAQNFRRGLFTDHNGHYFLYMAAANANHAQGIFNAVFDCQDVHQIATTSINSGDSGYFTINVFIADNHGGAFGLCNQILVKGVILDCKTQQPLSGIAVTIAQGPTAFTGIDGSFEIITHDGLGPFKGGIFANSFGSCFIITCNNGCLDIGTYDSSLVACNNCTIRNYPVPVNFSFTYADEDVRSVKEGGRYGVSVEGYDLAGRVMFANLIGHVDVPSFLQKGNYNPSEIIVTLLAALNLPKDIAYISYSVTSEENNAKYLQWVGDSIAFLDQDGNTLADGNGAIRAKISIQSLLDYNKQNNFSTTVEYQFSPGDYLRIYDDGSGNLFDPVTNNGFLDFQILGSDFAQSVQGESVSLSTTTTDATTGVTTTNNTSSEVTGSSLYIAFDKRLLVLIKACGFWIELKTPQSGQQTENYFEDAAMYFSGNSIIPAQVFTLNVFDSYYQNRSMHLLNCSGKAFLHPFVSSSISDFWGINCTSGGRLLERNTQAVQRWYDQDVIKSDAFVNEGQINGFGTWRQSNRKSFEGQERGGIVGCRAQNKLIIFICQNDWFLTDYDLNLLRATADGLIVANANQVIGDPQQKMEATYGCEYENTGTIQFMEGKKDYIFWADAKKETFIINDYRTASPYTEKGGAEDGSDTDNKGYFSDKFNMVRQWNNTLINDPDRLSKLCEIRVGINNKYKEASISFRKRNGLSQSVNDFVNTEREKLINPNETFTYSISQSKWVRFETFVPEFYGSLSKSLSGDEFIAFMNGIPYFHNSKDVKTFNEFFGVSDTQVIDVAFYPKEDRELTYQAIIMTAPLLGFFADRITTNNPLTYSYIPPSWVKKKLNKFYSTLLRNMLTYPSNYNTAPSMLIDMGGKISGEWVRVRLVRDLTQLNAYSEIDHILMQYISTSQK